MLKPRLGAAKPSKKVIFLSLAALGVVYGDIGTSPLYAVNTIFFGGRVHVGFHFADILGAISLVIWSLSLLIAFKYITFVLRADNHGEGGVFALYGLIEMLKAKRKLIFLILLMIAAGLLFGDGIITPAISVISSVEGLSVATNVFTPYIVPITLALLTGLFLIQSKGTAKVGLIFGPVISIWFASIAFFGAVAILHNPAILLAANPYYAVHFFTSHSLFTIFVTLGAVMLAITGGEALYADLGHFGRLPIRLSWFSLVYPALLLNYFGQGAYLLSGHAVVNGNIFFSMIPHQLIYPMVIVATLATIIASQALISGAFSLASQAISLGLFPMVRVIHTHMKHEGQIYVPVVNWLLYIGCIILVVAFRSSARLASAYGLAVSGVMVVTSLSMIMIANRYWKWPKWATFGLFIPFIIIDATFMSSNSLKIVEGGYIPLAIGFVILAIMTTWKWGRDKILQAFASYPTTRLRELVAMKESPEGTTVIPKTFIVMTPQPIKRLSDRIPITKQLFLDRFSALPRNTIFLTVNQVNFAHLSNEERFKVKTFYDDKKRGSVSSVQVSFGFMEEPNVEKVLEHLAAHKDIKAADDHKNWVFYIIQERVLPDRIHGLGKRLRYVLFMLMRNNSASADVYYGLGKERYLSSEILPVYF